MSTSGMISMLQHLREEVEEADLNCRIFAQKRVKRNAFNARKNLQTIRKLAFDLRKTLQAEKKSLPSSRRRVGIAPTAALKARAEKRNGKAAKVATKTETGK